MLKKAYLEISNSCNLSCSFCHKTKRELRFMSEEDFTRAARELRKHTEYLYFHLMGEPLLHAHLPEFVVMAREKGFVPVLTTNGTLLPRAQAVIEALPHKVQISLHAPEGNGMENLEQYMEGVMQFAKEATSRGIVIVLRLWNKGGYDSMNDRLLEIMASHVPQPWSERYFGWCLAPNLYLEFDDMFEWPDSGREEYAAEEAFCYALRNQIGVLADGTVVPCCLDHDGDIALGNLFEQSLEEILASPRARAIYDGFTRHEAVEPLCRRCGYMSVTKRFRKKS
jgi:radical SAM protein with 4Fe4S-binding SPASM domain